jgi:hypothetical protein
VTIVEGYGELEALPTLIRRIARQQLPAKFPKVTQPIRVSASQFLKFSNEFARTLKLASNLTEDAGAIVIVLDCDDDCPKVLGPEILCKAKAIVGHDSVRRAV